MLMPSRRGSISLIVSYLQAAVLPQKVYYAIQLLQHIIDGIHMRIIVQYLIYINIVGR